jgi:hypothetical protein
MGLRPTNRDEKLVRVFAAFYEVALSAEVVGAVEELRPIRCLIGSMHLNE